MSGKRRRGKCEACAATRRMSCADCDRPYLMITRDEAKELAWFVDHLDPVVEGFHRPLIMKMKELLVGGWKER